MNGKFTMGKLKSSLKKNEKKLARSFNLTFRYIDDVLSLNNSRFGDFVDSIELEITYITDTDRWSIVCTHRYADCLLKNMSTKNKYVVNQKPEHADDISFRELFGKIKMFLYKIRSVPLHLEIDREGRLRTKLYDKKDDFNFPIVNFPFISSNIPAAPAYEVYISQLKGHHLYSET
jgi:hypothetical protein